MIMDAIGLISSEYDRVGPISDFLKSLNNKGIKVNTLSYLAKRTKNQVKRIGLEG